MKILILTAMDKEMQLVLNLLHQPVEIIIDGVSAFQGYIDSHEIIVSKCGIGKVNAALKTLTLIRAISPDLVINSGVAGGAGVPVGTLLIADKVAYDDVWCGPGTTYGEADGFPLFFLPSDRILQISKAGIRDNEVCFGLICSGDKFISTHEEISFIRTHFPEVKAVDMESAAIAQACYFTGTPFAIIRVVSDTPGEGENISQYQDFWKDAPHKTFKAVKTIIEAIKPEDSL